MKKRFLSMLVLLLMAATGAWADTTVTWTASDMSGIYIDFLDGEAYNNTIKGITVTASGGGGAGASWDRTEINLSSGSTTITFTSSVGNIKSIEIKGEINIYSDTPSGWTLSDDYKKLSWSGEASTTVPLPLSGGSEIYPISEIVFTIESTPAATYIVAGNNAEIFGNSWDGTYEANKMTKGGDGKYTKTYNVEDAIDDIQFKVVKDGEDWIGDETGNNVTFSMKQAGSFTVTLDPNANPVYVTVTGDYVVFANTEYAINYATGMQNGTVTGPDNAKEDDEVTLTITPAAGYVLESISVTGVTTENAVEVTDGKFTMPAEDVNVIATFKLVTYAITLAEGTEDFDKWTISPTEAAEGATVTATYSGERKVKSVKAVKKAAATTTLDNTITAWTAGSYAVPAGGLTYSDDDAITVSGDVTLVLTDGETLTLNKGISLASGATLTIQGNGTMNVNGTNENTTSTVAGTGMLVLTSGTLTATGGNGGSVDAVESGTPGGNGGVAINGSVTVSGGTLTASGGNGGSVDFQCANCSGGNGGDAISGDVIVSGGSLTASGGNGGSVGELCHDCSGGNGGDAISGTLTKNGGSTSGNDGSNGSIGNMCDNCTAGTGGKDHN